MIEAAALVEKGVALEEVSKDSAEVVVSLIEKVVTAEIELPLLMISWMILNEAEQESVVPKVLLLR